MATREQILAEIKRRGLQVPTAATARPNVDREAVLAEIQRRGLTMPAPTAAPAAPGAPTAAPIAPGGLPEDVPTEEALAIQPQAKPERGIGEQVAGVGETVLSAITGATGGSIGMMRGVIEGLYKSVQEGTFGTPAGVQDVERTAMQRAQELTYEPRTEAGQEYAGELGELTAPMQAIGPGMGQIPKPAGAPGAPVRPAAAAATKRKVEPVIGLEPGPSAQPNILSMEELAQQTSKAAGGGRGAAQARKIILEQAMPNEETLASARRLNIEEHLQPDHVTTNQQFREVMQAVKSQVGSEARQAELQGFGGVAKRADDLITEMGGSDDWSTLARNTKGRLRSVQNEFDEIADKGYKVLRDRIPAKTPVDADNILGFVNNRADELGGTKYLTTMEKKILKRMTPKEGQPPSYALLDQTRKDLTAARVKKQGPFKDADSGLIKKLESEMLEDQRNIADDFGMLDVFNDARRAVAIRKSVEKDMTSLFGRELDRNFIRDLTSGVKELKSGDASKFNRIISKIPEEMRQEVVASSLDAAFGKTARSGKFNFNDYTNWHEAISKNKGAHDAFTKHLPEGAKQQLKDLANVTRGIRDASRERITTGRILDVKQALVEQDDLVASIYGLAKRSAANIAGEAVTTAAGIPGAGTLMAARSALIPKKDKPSTLKAADTLISSPEFIEQARTGDMGRFAKSGAFKRFVKATGNVITTPELWVIEAMRPPQQAPAEQEPVALTQ